MKAYKAFLQETLPSKRNGKTKQDLDAYLAGFFDGEGHISISRSRKRPWSCYVDVGCTNTVKAPLLMFVRAYGGKVYPKVVSSNRKPCFVWRCSNAKNASWALARMLPWLQVKRVRARAALIVMYNKPLACVGGQVSAHQKMAITKALKGLHLVGWEAIEDAPKT